MIDFLNRSITIINNLNNCSEYLSRGGCLSCLQNNFYYIQRDTYECLKKLCYYTINYGPTYVNEIYRFLQESKLL